MPQLLQLQGEALDILVLLAQQAVVQVVEVVVQAVEVVVQAVEVVTVIKGKNGI